MKDFLGTIPKAQSINIIYTLDFIQIETMYSLMKDTVKRMKKQAILEEFIHKSHVWQRTCIPLQNM